MNSDISLTKRFSSGFTLMEMLVAMTLFSIVMAGVSGAVMSMVRRLGYESRLATSIADARKVVNTMSAEIRMASTVSPYLLDPGVREGTCDSAISLADQGASLVIRVSHDSDVGEQGRESFVIGYHYDQEKEELWRGEKALPQHNCDPADAAAVTNAPLAQVIARNLIRVDADEDGVLDEVFGQDGSLVTITLGLRVATENAGNSLQILPLAISVRAL